MEGYLRGAALLVGCSGIAVDILDPRGGPPDAPHIFPDGEWVWPSDLPYYVETYYARLPDEFARHVRKRGFRPPAEGDINLSGVEL
jgi:hypothetical protein